MALYNEILTGRYNRFLQKFLGMKGRPPAPQLASEMMAVWSLFHGRENRYLEGWRCWGARAEQAAVAAQDTVVRFSNPPNSGVVAVIESLTFNTSAADTIFIEQSVVSAPLALLGTTFTALGFDPRSQPSGVGTGGAACQLSSANNVGQGARVVWGEYKTLANQNYPDLVQYDNQEWTVLPGTDFQVRDSVLNVLMELAIRWRERVLEESELT